MTPTPGEAGPRATGATRLTKSRFLAGLQCLKRVYLAVHAPDLATPPDEATRAILDMGTEVGALARSRFPGGVLVGPYPGCADEARRRTAELLDDPAVPAIFEGAFEFDRVLVRVDVLERVSGPPDGPAWRIIEVKSSTRIKDVHLDDLAVQAYVVEGAGVQLAGAGLMYVNTQYVFAGGTLDLTRYFALEDVTAAVAGRRVRVAADLAGMRAVLDAPTPPAVEPDAHCHSPYECPFWEFCTREKSARWIFRLPGGGRTAERLAAQGVQTMDEIPSGFKLTVLQRRVKENAEWIGPGLAAALRNVRYPVHHVDFETFMPAIPKFAMTRPYQVIPAQWSNHIEEEDGTVRHEGYLCTEARDPREEFAETLLKSLGETGSVCVYSGYERTVLEQLGEALPNLKPALNRVVARLWDLLEVLKANYYHPVFEGSFSVKAVLPALVLDLGYDDLAIRDGGTAAGQYYRMVFEETDWVEKERIREALQEYCTRDTLAMLRLRHELLARASSRSS